MNPAEPGEPTARSPDDPPRDPPVVPDAPLTALPTVPTPALPTVSAVLNWAHDRDARIDLRSLLGHVLEKPLAWLFTHPEQPLAPAQLETMAALWQRRLDGEPIAYLTGLREFHGLSFAVGPAVLIPRPETELLVDLLLQAFPPGRPGRVLDLGTGSGAIAVTLACRRPHLRITATDRSAEALDQARANAERLAHNQVLDLRLGDWYAPLQGERFDMIVSNPPYIAEGDPHLGRGDLRFEPATALSAAEQGLADLRKIIQGAQDHLAPGGSLMLEHGFDQAAAVRSALGLAGFVAIRSERDLAGIERVSIGSRCIDQPESPDYAQGLT